VASGVAGMYEQPIRGARTGGVKGLMKGTLKGLGGVVVKPISGGLDFIMKTSEGAHNMMKFGGKKKSSA
jgi:vacuolar protein sorting-associated protein 13A/C